jgi:hypothetical protein
VKLDMCAISEQVNHRHGVPPTSIIAHRGRPLRPFPAELRAEIAVWLIKTGRVKTLTGAAAVVKLSTSYVHTMLHATDEERAALAWGEITLSRLHNKKKARPEPVTTNEDVVSVIEEIGPDRVWAAFDKITAPMMSEAAE